MEETPKVHSRNRHHHQQHQHHSNANSSSRHRQREQRRDGAATAAAATTAAATALTATATVAAVVTANVASAVPTTTIAAVQLATQKTTQSIHLSAEDTLTFVKTDCATTPTPSGHTDGSGSGSGSGGASASASGGSVGGDSTLSHSQTQSLSQPTVVLVNGRLPINQNDGGGDGNDDADNDNKMMTIVAASRLDDGSIADGGDGEPMTTTGSTSNVVESPTQQQAASSRNSSGDAMSLRETLQQLPASTVNGHHHHHHHHHHSHRQRQRQPSPQAAAVEVLDSSFHRGILGYMDRELKQSASPTPSALSAAGTAGPAVGSGGSSGSGGVLRKLQSLSDPQASPAQRSIRSRSSLEKSPRRKRSKSESRRRRERKLIAAGEMEVRQANETLMRYLKQCSEMNDASLSGELEIDHNYDERRVHRKTKSQRDKRGHIIHKLYTTGGLSSILKELSDDIVPADGEEIYNPFTPVVSPTDDMPTHIDKMFLQTSSGYRPVERCYYKHPFAGTMSYVGGGGGGCGAGRGSNGHHTNGRGRSRIRGGSGGGVGGMHAPHIAINGDVGNGDDIDDDDDDDVDDGGGIVGLDIEGRHYAGIGGGIGGVGGGGGRGGGDGIAYINRNYCDTHYLLAAEYERPAVSTNIHLACVVQRIWHLISNVCHGLIAGLALAHLILVLSTQPTDWQAFHHPNDNDKAAVTAAAAATANTANSNILNATKTITTEATTMPPYPLNDESLAISHYATFADVYLNSFYCLALLCLISVFDRMDICSWQLSAHSNTEFISFRWLIIAMIYIVTIILTICSTTIDEQLYYSTNANVTLTQTEVLVHSVRNLWNSLAVTRSIAAICGWLLIGTTPQKDMLYEHLVDLSAYQLTNN